MMHNLHGRIDSTLLRGRIDSGYYGADVLPYEGEYSVLPSTSEQVLPTAGKKMDRDMTVFAIPLYEVSNRSGTTVSIGEKIEIG